MMLIDADKCPCFKCARTSNRPCPVWLCDSWCSWLQKIAYDVDGVIGDISRAENFDSTGHSYVSTVEAIDIVKRGGIK